MKPVHTFSYHFFTIYFRTILPPTHTDLPPKKNPFSLDKLHNQQRLKACLSHSVSLLVGFPAYSQWRIPDEDRRAMVTKHLRLSDRSGYKIRDKYSAFRSGLHTLYAGYTKFNENFIKHISPNRITVFIAASSCTTLPCSAVFTPVSDVPEYMISS
jgi:hypothetical protein